LINSILSRSWELLSARVESPELWPPSERPLHMRTKDRARMSIPRMITHFPAIAGLSFKAQQRQIRRSAQLLRIDVDFGVFLMAIEYKDGCIQVQEQRRRSVRASEHLKAQPVVKLLTSFESILAKADLKSTKSLGIRISRETRYVLYDTVVPMKPGGLSSSQLQDHRVEKCQERLAERASFIGMTPVSFAPVLDEVLISGRFSWLST
jgi:hypothetical protein